MKAIRILCCFVFVSLALPLFCFAQQNDARLRTGVKLEKELSKKFDLGLETQFRLNNNWSDFDKLFLEPALKYQLTKNWRIQAIYRYSWKQNKANKRFGKHRGSLFIGRKDKLASDWQLKYKTGIEYEFRSFGSNYNPKYNTWTNRNEVMLVYDFFGSPFSAEVGSELFINVGNSYRFNQVRAATEINYSLSKKSKFSVQYLIDFKLQAMGIRNHIFGFIYQFKIG